MTGPASPRDPASPNEPESSGSDAARPEPARPTSGPAPRWGEYAPVPPAPAPPVAPTSAGAGTGGAHEAVGAAGAAAPSAGSESRPVRKWDRILTLVLLAFATYSVITGLFTYGNLPAALDQVFAMQGIGRFDDVESARTIGLALNILHLSVYALTVWLSYRMLKQNRITFWVPLTAGVVVSFITAVLLVTLVIGDPAFREYVTSTT
ncbi:DUF6264 family protein [Planctomonas psychrotolerans]|uniref:DUF6264 family protein n=1 Tax=Planctomonas psychrotolerans TaxID=2528712 RepID=UPI00123A4D28|nr:DUF6264 family protein [Planctomonas psychrotolerans]